MLEPKADTIYLPTGIESVYIDHKQPIMDIFICLCSMYGLNPSKHNLILKSFSNQPLFFKPSQPLDTIPYSEIHLVSKSSSNYLVNNNLHNKVDQEIIINVVNSPPKYIIQVPPEASVQDVKLCALDAKLLNPEFYTIRLANDPLVPLPNNERFANFGCQEVDIISIEDKIQPQLSIQTLPNFTKSKRFSLISANKFSTMPSACDEVGFNYEKKKGFFSLFKKKNKDGHEVFRLDPARRHSFQLNSESGKLGMSSPNMSILTMPHQNMYSQISPPEVQPRFQPQPAPRSKNRYREGSLENKKRPAPAPPMNGQNLGSTSMNDEISTKIPTQLTGLQFSSNVPDILTETHNNSTGSVNKNNVDIINLNRDLNDTNFTSYIDNIKNSATIYMKQNNVETYKSSSTIQIKEDDDDSITLINSDTTLRGNNSIVITENTEDSQFSIQYSESDTNCARILIKPENSILKNSACIELNTASINNLQKQNSAVIVIPGSGDADFQTGKEVQFNNVNKHINNIVNHFENQSKSIIYSGGKEHINIEKPKGLVISNGSTIMLSGDNMSHIFTNQVKNPEINQDFNQGLNHELNQSLNQQIDPLLNQGVNVTVGGPGEFWCDGIRKKRMAPPPPASNENTNSIQTFSYIQPDNNFNKKYNLPNIRENQNNKFPNLNDNYGISKAPVIISEIKSKVANDKKVEYSCSIEIKSNKLDAEELDQDNMPNDLPKNGSKKDGLLISEMFSPIHNVNEAEVNLSDMNLVFVNQNVDLYPIDLSKHSAEIVLENSRGKALRNPLGIEDYKINSIEMDNKSLLETKKKTFDFGMTSKNSDLTSSGIETVEEENSGDDYIKSKNKVQEINNNYCEAYNLDIETDSRFLNYAPQYYNSSNLDVVIKNKSIYFDDNKMEGEMEKVNVNNNSVILITDIMVDKDILLNSPKNFEITNYNENLNEEKVVVKNDKLIFNKISNNKMVEVYEKSSKKDLGLVLNKFVEPDCIKKIKSPPISPKSASLLESKKTFKINKYESDSISNKKTSVTQKTINLNNRHKLINNKNFDNKMEVVDDNNNQMADNIKINKKETLKDANKNFNLKSKPLENGISILSSIKGARNMNSNGQSPEISLKNQTLKEEIISPREKDSVSIKNSIQNFSILGIEALCPMVTMSTTNTTNFDNMDDGNEISLSNNSDFININDEDATTVTVTSDITSNIPFVATTINNTLSSPAIGDVNAFSEAPKVLIASNNTSPTISKNNEVIYTAVIHSEKKKRKYSDSEDKTFPIKDKELLTENCIDSKFRPKENLEMKQDEAIKERKLKDTNILESQNFTMENNTKLLKETSSISDNVNETSNDPSTIIDQKPHFIIRAGSKSHVSELLTPPIFQKLQENFTDWCRIKMDSKNGSKSHNSNKLPVVTEVKEEEYAPILNSLAQPIELNAGNTMTESVAVDLNSNHSLKTKIGEGKISTAEKIWKFFGKKKSIDVDVKSEQKNEPESRPNDELKSDLQTHINDQSNTQQKSDLIIQTTKQEYHSLIKDLKLDEENKVMPMKIDEILNGRNKLKKVEQTPIEDVRLPSGLNYIFRPTFKVPIILKEEESFIAESVDVSKTVVENNSKSSEKDSTNHSTKDKPEIHKNGISDISVVNEKQGKIENVLNVKLEVQKEKDKKIPQTLPKSEIVLASGKKILISNGNM